MMFHRYLELLTVGCSVPLHRDELLEMLNSSTMILGAISARVENVKGADPKVLSLQLC